MDCTGFKLYKHSGDSLGVVGYVDLDSSQIGIEMSIFHTIFCRPTVAPNYAQVFHCEADVTGLGINTYFSTLQYGASSPESFVPSLAYYNTSRRLYRMTNFTNYEYIILHGRNNRLLFQEVYPQAWLYTELMAAIAQNP